MVKIFPKDVKKGGLVKKKQTRRIVKNTIKRAVFPLLLKKNDEEFLRKINKFFGKKEKNSKASQKTKSHTFS